MLTLVLLLVVAVRLVVAQVFFIPSVSMAPTLLVGDRILVDKLAYTWADPERGDIVVFRTPGGVAARYPDLVKRIIGLPGDVVGTDDGRVTIDGRLLAEPWLPRPVPPTEPVSGTGPYGLESPYRVPVGEYYVMGDNRTDSEDSRYFGPVPRSAMVGRMVAKLWPVGRLLGTAGVATAVLAALVCMVLALRRRPLDHDGAHQVHRAHRRHPGHDGAHHQHRAHHRA